MKYLIFVTTVFLFLFNLNALCDVSFEMEYKQSSSDKADTTNTYIKDNLLKMDFIKGGSNPDSSIIFRSDKEEMITIDHNNKTYFVMDKESMNQLSGQMNATMAQMDQAMKEMTPEEREMMKKMMKNRMPDITDHEDYIEPVLKNMGESNVNGYSCIKYDVYRGNEKTRQYCVTDWSNINGSKEIKDVMIKMSDFMEQFRKSFSTSTTMFDSSIEFERNIFLQLSNLNGFPVQTIDFKNGTVSAVSTFKKSNITNLDISRFDLPDGYKVQKLNSN